MPCDPRYMTLAASSKLVISSISSRFRFSGPGRISMPMTPGLHLLYNEKGEKIPTKDLTIESKLKKINLN